MWFHFCTVNHNAVGRATLGDMAAWFEAGLLDLGHRVSFSENMVEPAAINIFWECFDPGSARAILDTGVTFGIIATEIPDGSGFNWRTEPQWQSRFASFHQVAAKARFIWCMVEDTVPFYSRFCPSAFVELGFSERLVPDYTDREPEFDFSFFGLRTPYRMELIGKLSRYARVEWPEAFLSARQVGELIAQTRVGLNFKQSPNWPVPSPTRLGRFLMARRDLACEWTPTATRQGELLSLCPRDTAFPDFCLERLHSDWRGRAEAAFEAYREQMPMRRIMEALIDRTCATLPPSLPTDSRSIFISGTAPPRLLKTIGHWNIVSYGEMYFALHHSLGPCSLQEGMGTLAPGQAGLVRWSRTLGTLEAQIEHGPEAPAAPEIPEDSINAADLTP